jgi:tellurite resistance protein TehA-like permease
MKTFKWTVPQIDSLELNLTKLEKSIFINTLLWAFAFIYQFIINIQYRDPMSSGFFVVLLLFIFPTSIVLAKKLKTKPQDARKIFKWLAWIQVAICFVLVLLIVILIVIEMLFS